MAIYTARLCWNSNNWISPTGEAKELETGSYVTQTGFGQEEWLFNYAWQVDDYHYAFLQPVNKSRSLYEGQTIHILLYSINPKGDRVYVGELPQCEVLTIEQAGRARHEYENRGWLNDMRSQVEEVGGDSSYFDDEDPTSFFNIRFRPDTAQFYDPAKLADKSDSVWKRQRYTLAAADEQVKAQWRTRKPGQRPPSVQTLTQKGRPSVSYDPVHAAIQKNLCGLLEQRYGSASVEWERDYVDIIVRIGARTILIEIKPSADARIAIRNALGQLLEYAYFDPGKHSGALELAIVSPAPPTRESDRYIRHIRSAFGIPIRYCQYRPDELIDLSPSV